MQAFSCWLPSILKKTRKNVFSFMNFTVGQNVSLNVFRKSASLVQFCPVAHQGSNLCVD